MKKQIFSLVLLLFVTLSFSAQKTLSRIVKSGELKVGMTMNQPPYCMKDKDGNNMGFEVDLAQILAESMGVKLNIVQLPFGELLPALESGKVDAVMSGMTITLQRNMKSMFAGPYTLSGKSILTKSSVLAAADEAADVNSANYKIVCLQGSNSEEFVETFIPDAQMILAKDYDAGIEMILNGSADAMVADFPICVVAVFQHGHKGLVTLDAPLTIEPIGMALPAGDVQFHNLIDNYLVSLELSGALELLEEMWFNDGTWLLSLPQ